MRLFALLIASSAMAAPVDFVREVRPIFAKRCYECHSEKKSKSGLRLDVKAAALHGGDNHGPDIVPGRAKESPLIRFITTENEDELMPPKERLAPAEIETLTRWINEGAHWPDGVDTAKLDDKRDHWAFKPLQPIESKAKGAEIDFFIDAKLAAHGLHRSPPADPVTWLRRVTFDLTGLPPTPEEVSEFQKKMDFTAVVERLLASPRYGERWAQHWLDVVRYADTHGFEVNTERPNAWPYRDHVIRAFNNDTPYDRFIREQIAGDALGEEADSATGFLITASVLLPGQIGKDAPSMRLARQDSLDEIVNNIGQTFLGLSIGCARCHDHKFDPITAKDYYAMQAFVAGVEYANRPLKSKEAEAARAALAKMRPRLAEIEARLARFVPLAKSGAERPMINARENADRFPPVKTKRLRFTIRATNMLEPCIDELEVFDTHGNNVALASVGVAVTASGEIIVADRHDLKFVNDGRHGNSSSWMSSEKGKGWLMVEFAQEQAIERVTWGRDRLGKYADRLATDYVIEVADASGDWRTVADASDRQPVDSKNKAPAKYAATGLPANEANEATALIKELKDIQARVRAAERTQEVFAGKFRAPDEIRRLDRGDPEQPKEEVPPAVPVVFGDLSLPKSTPEQQRRKVLADWIASPQNPLTARVMVNRIWQGHFGAGLVATPSDFGRSGMKPTHPELLDWLAAEFIRNDWSVKPMHRLIVLSATYRQSSATDAASALKDATARFLWRFPARRLEAETIRDSMLAVSGRLNLAMHGRGFDLFNKRGGLSGFAPVETLTPENQRRMIYAHKVRREPEAVFGAFDCPDAGQSTALRRASTTPIQALNLFNSRLTLDLSAALAARVKQEAGADPEAQIQRAYQLAVSRRATSGEVSDALPAVRDHGLAVLCRALFNSSEFLFLP